MAEQQKNKIVRITPSKLILFLSLLCLFYQAQAQSSFHTFELADSVFLLDKKPFQMISGEMHYPRIPREAWRHRMKMAKAMGLNTIGTYVFWNVHEPHKGVYDFSGNHDIAAFVRTAQEEGLWVVLRPSPYVCAEWEFGGYPFWLQNEKDLVVRTRNVPFLKAYKKYILEIGKQLAPLQINHGGNVLMVQVENEYGFYSNDKEYLKINRDLFIEAGFDGLLYTCDPAGKVTDGHLPGLLPAVNGIDNPGNVKDIVKRHHNGKGPFYIAEWYPAWFDWWGTPHHRVAAESYSSKLDSVLAAGISINMYMFHGGSTRGFMNGANDNDKEPYEPQISSYDYDAPLDEAGNATEKFKVFRNIIQKHIAAGHELPPVPQSKKSMMISPITITESMSLSTLLGKPVKNPTPLPFEALNQAYGFVLYRTTLKGGRRGVLKIKDVRDYGLVFVNGKRVGILDRRLNQDSLQIELPKGKVTLEIVVENLGRVNFGPYLLDNKKGITDKVSFGVEELKGWEMFSLPFDKQPVLQNRNTHHEFPRVCQGRFSIQEVNDTYLDMSTWGKGCVWVNGHNLGRYWSIGPQQTLYVPAEWLKVGVNEVVVLELLKNNVYQILTTDKAILNKLQL